VNDVERFVEYALAFEEVLRSEDWTSLERFFADDAVHRVVGGGPLALHSVGRRAVIDDLRQSVAGLDRRFDERVPEVRSGPIERDGAVWMDWRMTLRRRDLPDLVVEGDHATHYRDGLIVRIDETIPDAIGERVEQYLARHDAALHPVGGPARSAGGADPTARMRAVVLAYGGAKSRADVEAALAVCHESFRIETIPFDVASRDRAETAAQLRLFFDVFPDYAVSLEELTFGEASAGAWGRIRMTMKGDLLGVAATGRTAELPFFSAYTFRDGLLASERFFFDLAALCDAIGVPVDELRSALSVVRAAQESSAAPA
jgi:hypothetical protein